MISGGAGTGLPLGSVGCVGGRHAFLCVFQLFFWHDTLQTLTRLQRLHVSTPGLAQPPSTLPHTFCGFPSPHARKNKNSLARFLKNKNSLARTRLLIKNGFFFFGPFPKEQKKNPKNAGPPFQLTVPHILLDDRQANTARPPLLASRARSASGHGKRGDVACHVAAQKALDCSAR